MSAEPARVDAQERGRAENTGEISAAAAERLVASLGAAVPRLTVYEVESALAATTSGAVDAVPGAQRAGISEIDAAGLLTSRAPTDEQVAELDRLQNQLAEGPCVHALHDGQRPVWSHDLAAETERWPAFAPRAVQLGAASVLSFRLSANGAPLGAEPLRRNTGRLQ